MTIMEETVRELQHVYCRLIEKDESKDSHDQKSYNHGYRMGLLRAIEIITHAYD
jgi:hypothetical protein